MMDFSAKDWLVLLKILREQTELLKRIAIQLEKKPEPKSSDPADKE